MKKECVAMLLAGGQGSRLYVLTGDMAKPAVPFGGKFRIIDFPLSNCANSGIDTVGVLTQYRPLELNSYIGNGQPWELDRLDGGVHILPPYQSATGASWYKGTANAIYQNIGFVDLYDPEYVAVLSGDHIYKMDYAVMLRRHKETGAACTIAVMEVPWAAGPVPVGPLKFGEILSLLQILICFVAFIGRLHFVLHCMVSFLFLIRTRLLAAPGWHCRPAP